MKKYIGTIQGGNFRLSPDQASARQRYLAGQKDGTVVEEVFAKVYALRSQKQLGSWFGLFCQTVLAALSDRGWDTSYIFKLSQPTGIEVTKDLLKEFMYSVCSTKGKTMSKMDTKEMAEFFDSCRNFVASQWSIAVAEPDPLYKEKQNGKV